MQTTMPKWAVSEFVFGRSYKTNKFYFYVGLNMFLLLELTTKEAVDLKVLLKLPMNRLRDLRRFLTNHNIKIFPSERPIYDELKGKLIT